MGVSRSGSQFAAKLDRVAKEIGATRKPIMAAALIAKAVIQGAASSAGVKPATAPVVFRMVGEGTAVMYGRGKTAIVNNPTKSHVIGPRSSTGHALGGGVLSEAGHPVPFVRHPGTRGKHYWEKSRPKAQTEAAKAYQREGLAAPLRAVFG